MTGGGVQQNPNGMGGTASSIPGTMNQGGYLVNINPAYNSAIPTMPASTPQWLKGVMAGNQLAQFGLQAAAANQAPMQAPMAPRPMIPQGQVGGVPSGVIPGSAGMAPPMMGGGLMGLNAGMPQGQQINPQILQMLLRARGGY